jgi:hypothetical protein
LAASPLRLTTSNFIFQTLVVIVLIKHPLTRGWVCRLQLLLVLASAVILSSESRETHDHILMFQIRDSPRPRIYIPQEQGSPVIHPGIGFPFRRLLRPARLRWRYSTPPPHWRLCYRDPRPLFGPEIALQYSLLACYDV